MKQWNIDVRLTVRCLVPLALAMLLSACGTNPVTGERELQFISTTQEIRMGEQAYFPTRQVQGGDYVVHQEVVDYVRQVNARVAQQAHRDLPFEIVVLNSSVPNAWAMPGGKMAINRGLLTQLNSEAELASVLGHEIVHSAARHSAQSQERGMLLQGGLVAAQVAAAGSEYRDLIAGGAVVGAQLVATKYGRDAELEADLYGMEYMHQAGYNPEAAVDLQLTFVRLSEGRQSSWLEGLFASHPPSLERVERNRETASRLGGAELEYGKADYKAAMAPLMKDQEAYKAHDAALQAARKKDYKTARTSVDRAIHLQPREAKFYGLKGDIALQGRQFKTAGKLYDKAISLYPDYFAFHLQKGYALQAQGNARGAEQALLRSNELLPTPNAQKALGDLALIQGDRQRALEYYASAAGSRSPVGQEALASMARLELEQQPGKYIKSRLVRDRSGRVAVQVLNQSPLKVGSIEVSLAYFDQYGKQASDVKRVKLRGQLQPGDKGIISTGLEQAEGLRSTVSRARIVR